MLKGMTAALLLTIMLSLTACEAVADRPAFGTPAPTQAQSEPAPTPESEQPDISEKVSAGVSQTEGSAGVEADSKTEAQSVIVFDSDRAVLLAQPLQTDLQISETGFYYGTDPDKLDNKVQSNNQIRGLTSKLLTELSPDARYYFQPYALTAEEEIRGEVSFFEMPAEKTWTAQEAIFDNTSERYIFLFGNDVKFYTMQSPPFGYVTRAEAKSHMEKLTVPVWKLSKGKKKVSKMSLTVHKKLASNVQAIFEEIFALEQKFPIEALAGFSYRNIAGPGLDDSQIMSHHSFGAAIDINKAYNRFYLDEDSRDPDNPYYIPREVIDIFASYGWAWGGDFKEGYDTMHFQYLGLDLTE